MREREPVFAVIEPGDDPPDTPGTTLPKPDASTLADADDYVEEPEDR